MISERSRGYVLGAIAAASYGLNPLFALPLYGAGLGVDSVLFYRYVLAVVMLGALMLFRRQSFALRRRDVLPLAAMGVLFSVSSLLLFESYNLMDAGIASTILFVYPVMVAVIMAVGFRERVTAATVVSIALACGGISLLYKGGDGATLNLAGVVLVFLSALSYAVWIVAVNRSSLKDLPTEKLTFYCLVFGSLVYVVRLRGCADLQPVPSSLMWVNAVALALFPTIVSLVAMAGAIRPHRFHAHGDPRGAGTRHGVVFRRRGLRRAVHAAHRNRRFADPRRRDAHHRRQINPHPHLRHAPGPVDGPSAPAALGRALGAPPAAAAHPPYPLTDFAKTRRRRRNLLRRPARLSSYRYSRLFSSADPASTALRLKAFPDLKL